MGKECLQYLSYELSHSLFDPLSFFQSAGNRSKSLVFISSTAEAATGSSQPELSQVFTADLKRDECKGLKALSQLSKCSKNNTICATKVLRKSVNHEL